eukprot:GSChrysophyteH1.ASY1.ANO1.3229.1 assembled CDS
MSDPRVDYLCESISTICKSRGADRILNALSSSKEVHHFLDDSNTSTLRATVSSNGDSSFTTDLATASNPDENSIDVMFSKRSAEAVTADNVQALINVQSLQGNPLDSLYNNLRSVWCPTLLQNRNLTDKLPPKVVQLLSELEQTLSASARGIASGQHDGDDIENMNGIHEPVDEIHYWQNLKSNRRSQYNALADSLDMYFYDISNPGFSDLMSLDFAAVTDLVNVTFDALNGIWSTIVDRQVYPQKRMVYLFDCIGKALCRYIQKQLSSLDLWSSKTGDVRIQLQSAVRICEQWSEVPKKLTSTFWPGNDHQWKGAVHEDTFMESFKNRLQHVLRIRTLSDELSQLLTVEERDQFQLDRLFAPLEDTQPLMYNPYTEPQWLKAVKEYEKYIEPVETAVAAHFRRNAAAILDHPQLLLREFQKYRNLLERPSIRRALVSERDVLLSLLKDYTGKMENTVDRIESGQDEGDDFGAPTAQRARLLSARLGGIIYLRQISSKIVSMLNTTRGLLDDLDSYPRFAKQCEALVSRIKGEEDARFDSWVSEMETKIEDDDASLRLQGSLMGWKDGILVVNFSDQLVQFLREVRQLDELGFDIPRSSGRKSKSSSGILKIADKAMEAEKYYRYGVLLKKTANFYNSISEQMIDVQEQLLLDSLTAFASIVSKPSLTRSNNEVSWANPAECENYIRMLQEAAEKLSSENHWLRKVHESLSSQAVALMQIDLLRQTETWKTKWRSIKEKMQTVKARYSEKDSRAWIHHWDQQIYKVLESTYQMGLESLNENLPEIRIEMVFSNKKLDLKPPLAQLRQNYYHEMKKFVAMPNAFDGFTGNKDIYKRMGPRNSNRLLQVYQKAENLFDKLQKLLNRYKHWVVLGQVDLDSYVEKNCVSAEEFLSNFKALRSKRKDIDKLPDQEKIDCCTVSLVPFKGFLEDLLQRVNDTLLVTLRRSLLSEFKDVDTFLENANDRLSTRPHSVEEIGNAKKQWKEIDTNKDSMKAKTLKSTLEEETVTLNVNIDKFGSRWRQLKPTEIKSWEYSEVLRVFDALEDWRKQFDELQTQATTLTDNMVTFGMMKPRFEGLESLVEDLAETNKSWDMLKKYYEELNEINKQDWLMFSTNVYALQDFATKWQEELRASFAKGSYDSVADHIITTVEKIKKCIPALKYCRGEPFKEDHWTELLQGKLRLPTDVRRENSLEILMEPSTLKFVKNLQARALGEVQIREALQELKAWERSAELSLLSSEEKLGDHQSLLGSLKESPFFKAFADQGLALEAKMSTLDFALHTLNSIQRKWVYLEPIFGRGSLPAEEARFRPDEQLFPQLADKLRTMLDQLERCQKALTDFLEQKRSAMPRFYFIVIQSHLKKLFQGIHKVSFNDNCTQITTMVSSANEEVPLDQPVGVSERVEEWLESLAVEMRSTLASLLQRCLQSQKFNWDYPSQVLCLAANIRFTDDCEHAIDQGMPGLEALDKTLRSTLREFTSHDLSDKPLIQLKMKALVFDLVHNIDVVRQLSEKRGVRLSDWTWKKQLRYYFENGKAVVKMHDACFDYTYEYQGNAPKLVHTPLTDKCYLTLTQGMHMGFGGNPYGPAGTGKTESVKALAACMGRQVLCGAWGCFDEFNRLKEDQLSAISQQIQIIQDAIKLKISPIQLLGRSVQGYGGRSRLPDNLKALFRPVAMGAPDNELIAEVSLVTEGFSQSKDLASKIVSLFKLSRQLLSAQQHYDWGLRALKAVLNSGGRLIQAYKADGEQVTPELTFSDTSKFLALIGDLEQAIKDVSAEKPFYLVEDPDQVRKMMQLKESLDQRMGCVIVGPSGCGKSTLWRVLKAAMIKCGKPWADGVLTDAARKVVRESSDVSCWIIYDNHLLTLPNGERINFGPNVNFLFETHDLKFASPATVSRMGMIFLSDEDLEVRRIVTRWLSTLPQERASSMSSWIDELFYKSLEFVLRCDYVIETTLVGTVMNGLSQIVDANSRTEFICGIIRGLGGNLPPDMGAPLDCYGEGNIGENAVINTITAQRTMACMESWITNMQPFILVGPEGCGKSMIINHAFRQKRNIGVATVHCNAQTTADDIISKIAQLCSLYSSSEGRVYRPRDCERLVLYLKDINLPRPDMYDTCQLIAFLQQIITFGGFYDEALEFLSLERIQIVSSINAATTVGRHQLSTRFTAVVRILVVDYPETSELVSVYNAFLGSVLGQMRLADKTFSQSAERERLANTIVDIYQKTREKFTVDDRRHYFENLLDAVANEANRIFRDRLVGTDPCSRFDQQLAGILRSNFRHASDLQGAHFTSLTSPRGTQGANSGKLRRMPDENFKKLVAQGLMYYEREERDINMLLFQESLEHVARMDRILSSFRGHLLLVGRCGVGRRNAATLASYMLGYEFYTPAVSRDYGPKQFIADAKLVSQVAGIKGEHVTLFLEDFQFTSDSMLEMVNSLLSSGEIPGIRVRKYLHIVLCMDPGHPKFLYRCESNPALYSQCAVQWIGEWRPQSLKEIPRLMEGIKTLIYGSDSGFDENDESKGGESKEDLAEMVLSIHASCVPHGANPKDYIVFLKTWYSLYLIKREELKGNLKNLVLEITKALANSSDRRNEVIDVKKTVADNEKATLARKAEIEGELSEIQPVLEEARTAAIADVLAAVLILLGVQDLSWLSMKKFLSGRGVKDDILNYDARRIDADIRKNGLRCGSTSSSLERELEEELADIDVRVAEMKTEFANKTAEAERLKRNLALAGETLDKAEALIGKLSGEQSRWKQQSGQIRSDITLLPTKVLLAAGFSTYLAKAPEDVRASMITRWQEITGVKETFSFKRVLSTESELLQWKNMGLPADDLSQENALVINNATDRVPFIIDPAMELAVRFGKTLLILEVDGVEPMLYPLCRKDLRHQGPRFVVNVGEKVIDYNEGFRMFLVTRNPDPEIPPDAAALMLRKEEDFKVQLADLEKELLQALATAEGNLLENTALIDVQLDEQREVYRPFAHTGSNLSSFIGLFKATLAKDMDSRNIEARLDKLCADLKERALYFMGRALFKKDRLMFALHLIKGMHGDHFQPKEWEIFTGMVVSSVSESVPRGFPSWAASDRQSAYRLLTENNLPSLKGVSPFQRVLIVQCFRPDRLLSALVQFCTDLLRIDSVSPPPLSLDSYCKEATGKTPMLLVSSPGADPSKELQEYAAKTIGPGSYEELAMGGGQQEVALHLLRDAATNGTWLCLKNLHLVVSWLPTLEKELSSLEPHQDFRLWLTSEEHAQFPSILLQESLKATFESPPGIKKNLQRTFDSWDPATFEQAEPLQCKLMYLLAVFHAVMQERRTYLPQGWTKFYEFSYGDLKAGGYVVEAAEILAGTPLTMPQNADIQSLRRIVNQLPDSDPPYIFCLPDNIERSLQRNNSSAVIKQLQTLSTLEVEGSKFDREKGTQQPSRRGGGDAAPVDDFVAMETNFAGQLCTAVDLTLASLKKVLFGSGLLTPAIQHVAISLLNGTVPSSWETQKRLSLSKWSAICAKGSLLDNPLALGDLFNPATFINALRQQTARALGQGIDKMKLICGWEGSEAKTVSKLCKLPCILSGLLLQGASFHAGLLQDASSDASEVNVAPNVTIGFVSEDTEEVYQPHKCLAVPTYFSAAREDFLVELTMPCNNGDQGRWTLAGVALFLTEEF